MLGLAPLRQGQTSMLRYVKADQLYFSEQT